MEENAALLRIRLMGGGSTREGRGKQTQDRTRAGQKNNQLWLGQKKKRGGGGGGGQGVGG